jgi:hypothetical protein
MPLPGSLTDSSVVQSELISGNSAHAWKESHTSQAPSSSVGDNGEEGILEGLP